MKRILIFSLAYYPRFVGGAEVAIKEITDRLGEEFEFDMITLRFDSELPREERIGNVNIHRIGFTRPRPTLTDLVRFPLYLNKVFFPITAYRKACQLHQVRHYDVVWSVLSYMGFPALFFNRRFPWVRFVLTLQEGDTIAHVTKRLRIRMVSFLYRRIFKKADIVQTISNFLADFARSMGYQGNIEVIPNGVDVKRFNVDRIDLERKNTLIITTSRLVEKNGVADIIEALTYLPENVELMVAGEGPLEQSLKAKVEELKLGNRVHFLGYVPHEKLPKYLQHADIFIRPSLSEGMGNSFIEAMAAGLPVIATPVGGIVDFLRDGETGLFCEVGNPRSIAQKVEKLMKDKESREYIIRNAKKLALERYDWNLIAREMNEKVFQRLDRLDK